MQPPSQHEQNLIQYDIIFIGQLGSIINNIFINSSSITYKCLIINNTKNIYQPSLLPLQNSMICIKKYTSVSCDVENGKIYKISPEDNLITIQTKSFRYRFLVYGTDVEDWCDYSMIQNLWEALNTKYSFVYSNIIKSDPKLANTDRILQRMQNSTKLQIRQLYYGKKSNIANQLQQQQKYNYYQYSVNIIFYIPKPPHGGYDNINILYKLDQFLQTFYIKIQKLYKNIQQYNKQKYVNQFDKYHNKLNCIVILEGEHIFPFCKSIDLKIINRLIKKNVVIFKNCKILTIDYLCRKISVLKQQISHNQNYQKQETQRQNIQRMNINFDYLYIVIKHKTPQLLSQCNINPFSNNPKTLQNSQYKNIFIIGGDIFPTSHSYQAINSQVYIISTNLYRLLTNPQISLKQYDGKTELLVWINKIQYIKFKHYYLQQQEFIMKKYQNKRKEIQCWKYFKKFVKYCCKCFQLPYQQILHKTQVQMFYNLSSYGKPYYFFVPEMNKVDG